MRHLSSLSRKSTILLVALLLLLSAAPSTVGASSKSLTLKVYSDGFVSVSQTFSVDPKASSVQLSLLSAAVSDLVATDQNGSPLSYSFLSGGSNITVYSLGAAVVNLNYDTDNLTAKNGTVWTLTFSASFNSTLVLPQFSTLGSVSGTPYSINQTDNYPEMTLSSGSWRISYGVPLAAPTTTPTTSAGQSLGGGTLTTLEWELTAAGVVVAAVAFYWWWRSRGIGPVSGDLRPDDLQVLNFIQEKGGKVLEPEIRIRFALPKTSAWRQIKRLERLGYVRVRKIGSQNQIELLKDRKPAE